MACKPTPRSRAIHLCARPEGATLCGQALHPDGEYLLVVGATCKACLAKARSFERTKKKAQKKRASTTARNSRVRKTYGLEPEDVEAIIEYQGGGCAICGHIPVRRPLDIDHNHKTGEIRGMICPIENRKLLTAARHNPAILRAAADYLENPPAQFVGTFLVPGSVGGSVRLDPIDDTEHDAT